MSSSKVIQIPFVDLGADFAKNESEYLEVFQKIGRSQEIVVETIIDNGPEVDSSGFTIEDR